MTEKGGLTPDDEPPPPYPGPTGYPLQQHPRQPSQCAGPYAGQQGILPGQIGGQPSALCGSQQQVNIVVVSQTSPPSVVQEPIPDNMGLAIFATLCCCFPLGIVAIMKASEARSAVSRGHLQDALLSSLQSRRYSHYAVGCGVVVLIAVLCLMLGLTLS